MWVKKVQPCLVDVFLRLHAARLIHVVKDERYMFLKISTVLNINRAVDCRRRWGRWATPTKMALRTPSKPRTARSFAWSCRFKDFAVQRNEGEPLNKPLECKLEAKGLRVGEVTESSLCKFIIWE